MDTAKLLQGSTRVLAVGSMAETPVKSDGAKTALAALSVALSTTKTAVRPCEHEQLGESIRKAVYDNLRDFSDDELKVYVDPATNLTCLKLSGGVGDR
eukprot:2936021-Amphidinium_carterae.2